MFERGDIIEIDTWVDAAGKNGMRRDWIIRDFKTQQVITRATRLHISNISTPIIRKLNLRISNFIECLRS